MFLIIFVDFLLLLQVTVGFLLPFAMLCAEEGHSRKQFERENALNTAFGHTAVTLFIRYLVLVPLESAVLFHTIVIILRAMNL